MAGHGVEMSARERADALRIARELAAELTAAGARPAARGELPSEQVALFRQSGLVGLTVPKRYGGMGADIATATAVARALGSGDPACALALGMHLALTGLLGDLLDEPCGARWLPRITGREQLVCGALSGTAGGAQATRGRDGGLSIDGRVPATTPAAAADLALVAAAVAGERRECLLIVAIGAPGIAIERVADDATATHALVLEGAAADALVADDPRSALRAHADWLALICAAIYLGLIDKAAEQARGAGGALGALAADRRRCLRALADSCALVLDPLDRRELDVATSV